jgi:DNA-binding CsgD family transcriptional regulator
MDQLSPREYEVAMLVARGLSNKEIARELGISTGTAKLHTYRIIKKLGVKSKSEAMMMILREAAARAHARAIASQLRRNEKGPGEGRSRAEAKET